MANEMNKYYFNNNNIEEKETGWEYKETLSEAGNGEWVEIPIGINQITIILDASSGSGKIQVTNDVAAIRAETTPDGIIDWDEGTVTSVVANSLCAPVAAIRQVNASGTTIMILNAQ